ncbi:unnamed protein product [Notodromas monacha]|uniref:PGF-CTERM sorting domain-containing protein n=1 Tax=Notodromas monacha TaxID=399045 RepID=A0A7R9BUR4_9CRUS|nr:unnamed protein product [Notodromas monacha]CAG0922120.1 unnamed protein product [Notodromas monacha]
MYGKTWTVLALMAIFVGAAMSAPDIVEEEFDFEYADEPTTANPGPGTTEDNGSAALSGSFVTAVLLATGVIMLCKYD